MKIKNTIKLILVLIAVVFIIIIVRSLPQKRQEKMVDTASQSANVNTEQISPTLTPVPTVKEKLDTPEELLERLGSDSDIDYTNQINAIESEVN